MTILLQPSRESFCWLATFGEGCGLPPGTYPLPFTADAPLHVVAAQVRDRFPGHRVTGVQANCVGCGQ